MSAADRVCTRLITGTTLVILLLGVGTAFVVNGEAKSKRSPTPQTQPSPTPTPIPLVQPTPDLTQISKDLDTLEQQLAEIKRQLLNEAELKRAQATEDKISQELQSRVTQSQEVLNALPSFPELQDLDSEWRGVEIKLDSIQKQFLDRATLLNADTTLLDAQQKKWSESLVQVQMDPSLTEVQSRVRAALDNVTTTRNEIQNQLKLFITLQTRLSQHQEFVNRLQEQIDAEKTQIQRGLLQPDSKPLWSSGAGESEAGLQRMLRRHLARDWLRLREFLGEHRQHLFLALVASLLSLILALQMRRQLPAWDQQGIVDSTSHTLIERPYSLAYLVGLLTLFPLLPIAPSSATGVLAVLFIVPVIRLLGPLFTDHERRLLYVLIISLLVVQTCKMTAVSASLKRQVLAVISIGIIGAIIFFSRSLLTRSEIKSSVWRSAFIVVLRVAIAFLGLSLMANVLGYFALSQVLNDAALFGAYYGIVIYMAYVVLKTISLTLLKTETANLSTVIRQHRLVVGRWVVRILKVLTLVAWILSLLRLFTVRDDLTNAISRALSVPLSRSEGGFTGGDVLSFLAVVIIGFLVATVVRVVLREDVLQRLPVSHGVPYAISTLTYYLMLLCIFFIGLLAAGVELSKFTLFTGAFGIGIGFGLQNTINNFASGLILLFERPIRERDILEVDGTFGEVTRIGMRSTSIRTAEEAEVIVPNSNLVAGKVVNWSRLAKRRPVELIVRAAYGTDPEIVIDLLVKTAASNQEVLIDPAPTAFLQKFGEKALEFSLVFWVARYHLYRRVLSEVAVSVDKAFKQSGISQGV